MPIAVSAFLDALFAEGRVRVSVPQEISADELYEVDVCLTDTEAQHRADVPGVAPPFFLPAARWAALGFHRACQFVAYRDIDEPTITQTLSEPCPPGDPASLHYSVDITFRYLPDLIKLARSAAENDPLVALLNAWAVMWPLSSVGIASVEPAKIDPARMEAIIAHPCLLAVYVDRILARRDRERLIDPRVRDAVQQVVGAFPDLAPGFEEIGRTK